MDKRIIIEGMSCAHCTGRVEKALNAIEGVSAKVDLKGADVSVNGNVSDDMLKSKVEGAGFKFVGIE